MEVSDLFQTFTVLLPVKDLKYTFLAGWVCWKAGLNSVEERIISANSNVNIKSVSKCYAYKLYITRPVKWDLHLTGFLQKLL
jgi:hypothetical protein